MSRRHHRLGRGQLAAFSLSSALSLGMLSLPASATAQQSSPSAIPSLSGIEGSGAATAAEPIGRPMPRSSALPPSAAPLLDGFDAAIDAYGSELEDYRRTVLELSRNEYRRQRTALLDFYNAGIDSRKVEERARRELAILDFERFLADYPSNPTITPDVLYRLAELHFEKESDAYNQRNDAYLADVEKFERGLLADEPSEPSKDFSRTIAIFERLIQEFPSYRQLDGAYYLIGYCYGEAGDPRSRSSYQALVDRFPESRFAQEAWVRIGESFFKEDKFEPARAAYEKALTYPRSRITDKALFKLGWATYLLNRYDAALKTFQQLLALYREIGSDETAALKEEALQYTAITLAEEDWNLDGSRDADFLMTRVKRYLGDATDEDTLSVLDRLSGILIENQRFTFAVDLLKDVIARTPLDPDNPRRHKVIVDAYSRAGQFDRQYFDAALEEMGKLGALYGPGSDWFHAQDRLGNTEAMAFAEELTRRSLKDSADYYYNEADTISREAAGSRDPAVRQRAIERFRFAARIYKQFLDAYPNDPEAYDSRMFLAQALFFSEQFTEAGSEFDLVRESVLGNRYQRDAALFSIQSYETALEREVTAGRLERRAWPSRPADPAEQAAEQQPSEDSGAPRTVAAREPIPEQSLKLVAAYDRYISLGIKDDQRPNAAANFAFASARLYYEYKDYDEARKRFVSVLDGYCGLDVTGYAAILLVESYRDVGDYAQMEFWADEVTRRGECIAIKDPEVMAAFKQDITRYQMGAISQQAEALVNEGKFDEAAAEYIRLANEFAGQQNGALGLYNAGLIYEQNLKKFDLAMQQFERLYRDYPGSEWVDKSLVRIAANSELFFDFDKAVQTLQTLESRRFSDPEGIEYPGLKAAKLLDYSQKYTEAATGYLDFVQKHPRTQEAPAALYQAGIMYEKAGNSREMIRVFERFRREYGNAPSSPLISVADAVVDSLSRTAAYYAAQNDSRSVARVNQQILTEFNARQPQSYEARAAAARLAYDQAMARYNRWDAIQLGETVAQQRRALTQRRDQLAEVARTFDAIPDYGAAEWTACAFFMKGRTFQRMADLLYQLPIPEELADDEYMEQEYQSQIEELSSSYEDGAVHEWEIAYPIMQRLGVVNQCTIDTTRQLNRYRGADYPVLSEPIDPLSGSLFSPQVFVPTPVEQTTTVEPLPGQGGSGTQENP